MIRTALILLMLSWTFFTNAQTPSNTECENAIEIFCGDVISGNTVDDNLNFLSTNCFFISDPRVWYSVVGDGLIHTFTTLSSDDGFINFNLISNDCDPSENRDCRGGNFTRPGDQFSIQIDQGEVLYIVVRVDFDGGNFQFMHECEEAVENDLCSAATPFSCMESVELSLEDSGDFSFTINCPPPPEEVTDIPTLGEWGLICLSLLLVIFGIVGIKQEVMDQAVD